MARKQQIGIEKRAQVEILSKEGYSERGIAKKLGLSKNGVHHCLQRLRETGLNIDRKRSGRPRVTSISEGKHLIISSKRNRRKTAPELTTEMNSNRQHPVSLTTVKRRLLSAGLRGCVAVKKPLLNKANKLKRLHWAKQHKDWTLEDWKKVLWTDESKFELFGNKQSVCHTLSFRTNK